MHNLIKGKLYYYGGAFMASENHLHKSFFIYTGIIKSINRYEFIILPNGDHWYFGTYNVQNLVEL